MTTYHLETDDCWDVWEFLISEHSLDVFLALWKPCKPSEKFCFLVVFQLLRELQSHISDVSVKTFKYYFGLKIVPEMAQLRKDSCSAYEDLVEKGKLTR